jgi:cysteinyl-tRNA synthetase
MVASANEALDTDPKNKSLKKETLANLSLVGSLLGFGEKEPHIYFQIGIDSEAKNTIEALLHERNDAKKNKNFDQADAIRSQLEGMGIGIMDTAEGTVWEKI